MSLRTCIHLLTGLLIGLQLPLPASAEFLQTGPAVYQTLREKIVVSYETPGIFIVTGPKRDIQLFDPGQIPPEESLHVFVRWDPGQERYSALLFGRNEYRIRGSLILSLGRVRVAIDNNNPYLTIVVDEESSVIGFQGLRQIVMAQGEAAVAFLEANQFDSFTDRVSPYIYKKGKLYLKGQPSAQAIGLSLRPPENICLNDKKVIYVTQGDLQYIKQGATPNERAARLHAVLDKSAEREPFEHSLHLRIEKRTLVSLDYREGVVTQTTPMRSKFSSKTVCLVRELQF